MTDTAAVAPDEQIVDAEIVSGDPSPEQVPPAPSTAVTRRERRSEVIRPLAADDLVDSFNQYQELLPKLLDSADYQTTGQDRFVKKSGWRKIAAAFDLDVILIRSEVERDENGQPTRAEVWARAIAPSGRTMDGDGYCSIDESRFQTAKGKAKVENDLRATATTRAMNRAISGLVGMGAVSAEEVDSSGGGRTKTPDWAKPAPDDARAALTAALTKVIGHDAVTADFIRMLDERTGGFPVVVALWLSTLPDWIAAGAKRAQGQ